MDNPYESPQSLSAETESRSGTYWSSRSIVIVGLLLPGIPSFAMRRSMIGMGLFLAIPCAFGFFGPFWDLVLFPSSHWTELGLYPFVVVCLSVPLLSVWLGFLDRRDLKRAFAAWKPGSTAEFATSEAPRRKASKQC